MIEFHVYFIDSDVNGRDLMCVPSPMDTGGGVVNNCKHNPAPATLENAIAPHKCPQPITEIDSKKFDVLFIKARTLYNNTYGL